MAIMGDSSDNIPGVPGIGEKGALKLIHQFGNVENLIQHVEKVSSKSQKNLIKEHLELLKEQLTKQQRLRKTFLCF